MEIRKQAVVPKSSPFAEPGPRNSEKEEAEEMKRRFFGWMMVLVSGLVIGSCHPGEEAPGTTASAALTASHEEAEAWAEKTLASLSLERKIGQMICEQVRGEYVPEDDPGFLKILALVREYGIGALVIYGGSPQDTASLLNRLQKESELPLLVSSDFEGGPGQQIAGATEFPANMALSAAGSEDLAYELGKTGAAEGRAIGIHITYSPVVDVQTQPDNPVLSVRSFGRDIGLLGRMAGAYIRGYQDNGMLATAKHFPGRGDVTLIPGSEFTINKKSAEAVEAEDFLAFRKAIEAGVVYVMSEHIAVPAVAGGSDLPASVEKALATDWLRDRLGFEGILTTDDMWYEKVVDRFGAVEACIMAVEAGHDAVLKPADAAAVIRGLAEAVRTGRISAERIDRSVRKILYWKARLNLHRNRFVEVERIPFVVGIKSHQALAARIADQSITVLKNEGLIPVDPSKTAGAVHIAVQKRETDPAPAAVAAKLAAAFPGLRSYFLGPYTSGERYNEALEAARKSDLVLISLFSQRTTYIDNGPLRKKDLEFLGRVIESKPAATLVISYGNPYLAESMKNAAALVIGYGEGGFYGNQIIYADSLIRLVKGEISPRGRLPVEVSASFPEGSGIVE
jgi:beta-N-acetylhexosaminidase